MKKLMLVLLAGTFAVIASHAQILKKIGNKIKDKTEQKGDQKVDETIDKEINKTDDGSKKTARGETDQSSSEDTKELANGTENPTGTPALKVYGNYDFVPGDKILFEDHFTDDQDGEFPAHWSLEKGQAVINKVNNEPAFFLTEGNYVTVKPRMKTEKYLTEPFTIEFDYYRIPQAYGLLTMFQFLNKECDCESSSYVSVAGNDASFEGAVSFSKSYPAEMGGEEKFNNKWHHVAIAFKNHQLKVYVDQFRVLVVPDTKSEFYSVAFGGIGLEDYPLVFKNVRVAAGGNMNMLGKKFTESKIVTHGINFDINKAMIRPESMGTLNMIVQVMKDNPEIKFEIGGHTDDVGAGDYNQKLSQQRAEAVKDQLIKMGIDAGRLTAKGFGEAKPISDNSSLEGKANNRRVEFTKL